MTAEKRLLTRTAASQYLHLELTGLGGSLITALKAAGWIEVAMLTRFLGDVRNIRIDVDASKDAGLLAAAETLASALNAVGIKALTKSISTPENGNASIIHILIGPKSQ